MLVKRSIGVAIVLFWCLMNVLLLKRQLWPPPPPITLRGAETPPNEYQESWGVFYHGEKIGHATQTITPKTNGYQIQDRSLLRLQLWARPRTQQPIWIWMWTRSGHSKNSTFVLQANDVKFHARGRVAPGKLILTVESGGHITTRGGRAHPTALPFGRPQTLRCNAAAGTGKGTSFFHFRSGHAFPTSDDGSDRGARTSSHRRTNRTSHADSSTFQRYLRHLVARRRGQNPKGGNPGGFFFGTVQSPLEAQSLSARRV